MSLLLTPKPAFAKKKCSNQKEKQVCVWASEGEIATKSGLAAISPSDSCNKTWSNCFLANKNPSSVKDDMRSFNHLSSPLSFVCQMENNLTLFVIQANNQAQTYFSLQRSGCFQMGDCKTKQEWQQQRLFSVGAPLGGQFLGNLRKSHLPHSGESA